MAKTHGLSKTPEYATWNRMLNRCRNPILERYKNYGGRGIKVCERWKLFVNFYADMGPKPSPQHSIGRIDNDRNYEPSNCRWETHEQQKNNTTRSVFIEHDGLRLTYSEWAARTGLPYSLIVQRHRKGLPPSQILTSEDYHVKRITVDGITRLTTEWMREVPIPISSFYYWRRKGMADEDIIKKYLQKEANAECRRLGRGEAPSRDWRKI